MKETQTADEKFEKALSFVLAPPSFPRFAKSKYDVARWARKFTLQECEQETERLRGVIFDLLQNIDGHVVVGPDDRQEQQELINRAYEIVNANAPAPRTLTPKDPTQ